MPGQSVNTSRNFVRNSMSTRVNGLLLDRVFKMASFRNGRCSKSLLIFSLLSLSVWVFVFVVPIQKRNSISVVEKADFTLWRILNTVNTFTLVDGHAPLPPEDETFADFKRYDL